MRTKLSQDTWVLIVLFFFMVILTFITRSSARHMEGMEIIPSRSSYSANPGGLRAFYNTLHALNYTVTRQTETLAHPPADGVLFLICPEPKYPITPTEWQSIEQWVRKGNTLVVAADQDLSVDQELVRSAPLLPSFLSPGVKEIWTGQNDSVDDVFWEFKSTNRTISLHPNKPHKKHVTTNGSPLVALFGKRTDVSLGYSSCGKGSVVVLADGCLLANRSISRGDNLLLALNAINHQLGAGKGVVTFDEYHHGYGARQGILSLIGTPARLGLAQVGIAFILLLFAVARRFGRIVPLREGGRRRSEYLNSMSLLLRRAHATAAVESTLERSFLDGVAHIINLPPGSDTQTVIEAISVRHPEKADAFRQLISHSDTSSKGNPSESSILALEKERNKFRKELMGINEG